MYVNPSNKYIGKPVFLLRKNQKSIFLPINIIPVNKCTRVSIVYMVFSRNVHVGII